MATPADAKIFLEPLDPHEILDYSINLAPLLEAGETISAHTVVACPESVLLGLEVKTTGGYATTLTSNVLKFYLGIATVEQANAMFNTGVTLPLEISITTNAVPPRKKQRTVAVRVVQR